MIMKGRNKGVKELGKRSQDDERGELGENGDSEMISRWWNEKIKWEGRTNDERER